MAYFRSLIRTPRSLIRTCGVIALALFALGSVLPDMNIIWNPGYYGDYGWSVCNCSEVESVDHGSAASKAGIRAGDTIDFRSASIGDRLVMSGVRAAFPDEHMLLRVTRGKRTSTVRMIASRLDAASVTLLQKVFVFLNSVVALAFVVVGALVVLLRPSRMTWAFYFFAVGMSFVVTNMEFWSFLPTGAYALILFIRIVLQMGATVAFLIFALRFPTDRTSGWKRWLEYASPILFLSLFVAWPYRLFSLWLYGLPNNVSDSFRAPPIILATFTLGAALLMASYFRSKGANRHKLKWVVAALMISYLGLLPLILASVRPSLSIPEWVFQVGNILNIFVPLSVAYAVIRHRVFDITFVISRAILYSSITLIAVAVFSLIDLIFMKMLANSTLGFVADASAAVVIGVSFNRIHGRLDKVIDELFFRHHYHAEQHILHLAMELPHAASNNALNRMLVSEPVNALELTSGIIFRRARKGHYVRQGAVGWPKSSYFELSADDPLVIFLRNVHVATRIPRLKNSLLGFPPGDAQPVLALPIITRNELLAFALYGAHSHGTDLDPDEVKALNALGVGAAVAYEHFEADTLRREIEQVRRENESLRMISQARESGLNPVIP